MVNLAKLDKAERLVADERVHEIEARVFAVQGESGATHVVVAKIARLPKTGTQPPHSVCSCPAGRNKPHEVCSHALAVATVLRAERAPADPFDGIPTA